MRFRNYFLIKKMASAVSSGVYLLKLPVNAPVFANNYILRDYLSMDSILQKRVVHGVNRFGLGGVA